LGTLKVCRLTGEGLVLDVGFVTGCYGASVWSRLTLFEPCHTTGGRVIPACLHGLARG